MSHSGARAHVSAGSSLSDQVARLRASLEARGLTVPGSPAAVAPRSWLGRELGGERALIATATTARTAGEMARQAVAAARAGADVIEVRADLLDAGHGEAELAAAGVGERVGARGRRDTGTGVGEPAVPGAPEAGAVNVGQLAAAYVDAAAQVAASLDGAGVPTPLLLTVRTAGEGGGLAISDGDYAQLLTCMLDGLAPGAGTAGVAGVATAGAPGAGTVGTRGAGAQADGPAGLGSERSRVVALDVELARGCLPQAYETAAQAGVDVVASAHFFDRTPAHEEITGLAAQMQRAGAQVAKIAVMPGRGSEAASGDVLTLLAATAQARAALRVPVITMSMGQAGLVTRLAGGLFGSALTFATGGDAASAPGQPPIEQVRAAWCALGLG